MKLLLFKRYTVTAINAHLADNLRVLSTKLADQELNLSINFHLVFFRQANGMRAHQKRCLEKKVHLCEFCPSKFNQLQSLKAHIKTHTGM